MSIVWNTGTAAMRFRLKNKKKKGIIMDKQYTYTKNKDGFMGSENRIENQTVQVTVQGGVVVDVKNLPEGWDLQIIDKDNEEN